MLLMQHNVQVMHTVLVTLRPFVASFYCLPFTRPGRLAAPRLLGNDTTVVLHTCTHPRMLDLVAVVCSVVPKMFKGMSMRGMWR
jgi:hypothetical protein